MSAEKETPEEQEEQEELSPVEFYKSSLRDSYRGLAGAAIGTAVSELILLIAGIKGEPQIIFALIGLVLAVRHLLQMWQAKQQLKELTGNSDK
jgi:hypothetical protein